MFLWGLVVHWFCVYVCFKRKFLGLGGKKIYGFKFLGLSENLWVFVYVCLLNVSYFSVWFERKS